MEYDWLIYGGIFAVVVVVFLLMRQNRKKSLGANLTPEMRQLIQQGIAYEDEFIERYFKMLRDEGFMHLFGGHKKQVHELMSAMIEESKHHREALEVIIKPPSL